MPRTNKPHKVRIGLDPSYTGTGIVALHKGIIIRQELITSNPKESVEQRMIYIAGQVTRFCSKYPNAEIYIEGLPYGKLKTTFAYQLGALHFYLRIRLHKRHKIFEVAPTELKMFVAGKGKGNCKKELILLKTFKRWGVEFEDNNLCDAYCLARFGIGK